MIQWRQHDRYHLRSDCGGFTISRAVAGAEGQHVAYTAWRVRPKQPGEIIQCHVCMAKDSEARDAALKACKAACEEAA